jgi:hypothetical protein
MEDSNLPYQLKNRHFYLYADIIVATTRNLFFLKKNIGRSPTFSLRTRQVTLKICFY